MLRDIFLANDYNTTASVKLDPSKFLIRSYWDKTPQIYENN